MFSLFGKSKAVQPNPATPAPLTKVPDKISPPIIPPISAEKESMLFKLDPPSTKVAQLPDFPEKFLVNVRYPLIPPFAFAYVHWDAKIGELIYEIEEPVLSQEEQKIFKVLEESIREIVNISTINVRDENVIIEYLEKNMKVLISEFKFKVSISSFQKMMYYIYRNFVGMNEIEPILADYFIEDIECNGINSPIYVIHRKYRNLRSNVIYTDIKPITSFVEKLAQKCGKYVSYASPLLDGRLPSGDRVNATYTQDISSKGPTFCFADSFIQLNNGSVKKVGALFEECKSNFTSNIENDNEVVDVSNVSCVGVDEHTLRQKDSIIKTVIKLPPPEELVKLELEDGSKIDVTVNHKFHVADGALKQVEAKDLKSGMFIPVPKKVNVIGCMQKIDVYSLIRDFSYSNKVCIKSDQHVKELVNSAICLSKQSTFAHRDRLSKEYNVCDSYFYEIISRGNSISFEMLNELCKTQNHDFNSFCDISLVVYGRGRKNREKSIKVPYEIDKELGYLAGALISDGHLSKNSIDIACYEESFRESVKECLTSKFGRCNSYYNGNRIYVCNVFVPYFMNKVFEIPFGKKSYTVKVPDVVFKSDNEVVASFIRGLFDGDGTVSAGLSYKTSSKELAEGLSYLLARLGIYSYIREGSAHNGGYRLNIPSPYYTAYLDNVGFTNLRKLCGLKALIARQKKQCMFVRHGRIPSKPIRTVIKKLNLSLNQLSKVCNTSYNRFYQDSYSKEFVKDLLECIKREKDLRAIKEELGYINWMVGSEQEFVKIKSVGVLKNLEKKHVYDIELKPCKYFIAGNKPMNVFDTIRKFTKEPWTPIKLMDFGTISPEILAYMWLAIEYESNLMIIGSTGSGKTSFLNSIAFFIPPSSRVVSIEDTKELNIVHENWLPSIARAGMGSTSITGERHGEVSLFDLLKESFRQRPDYVIVGEIRGQEAFVLFQGAASGHATMSTMHAESVETVVKRLETPPINLSPSIIELLDVVCVMIETKVKGKQVRRLREVNEIVQIKEGSVGLTVNTPFTRDPASDRFFFKTDSRVFEKICKQHGVQKEELVKEFKRRSNFMVALYRNKIFGFREVQDMINSYYKNPQETLKKLGVAWA